MDDAAAVLEAVDVEREAMLVLLQDLVRKPSVGGAVHEVEIHRELTERFRASGLDTIVWELPLAELAREPDFPGAEVDRGQALGVVARLPGAGGGPTLMFNGH